jgi:hypothetical protein
VTLKANQRLTIGQMDSEVMANDNILVQENFTKDIVRIEHIRPKLLLNQGQELEQDVNNCLILA